MLNESKVELEQDHAKLMAFIANDNAEKKKKEILEKEAFSKKADKDEQLKRLDIEIQQVKSEIEKNKDALSGLQ